MARIAAIEINNKETRILAAESINDKLAFTHFFTLSEDNTEVNTELLAALSDIAYSVAVLTASPIIYREIELPFDDQKKIERTAPLQLQDQLPFDIDSFTLDSIVLEQSEKGQFRIITSATPTEAIARTLFLSNQIGLDPKLITTKASSLTSLKSLFPEELQGTFAIIEVANNNISLAIFVEDKLTFLREISKEPNSEILSAATITEIKCCLEKHGIERIKVLAARSISNQLAKDLTQKTSDIDIGKLVVNNSSSDLQIEDISWAIGLLCSELLENKNDIPKVDFRVGNFTGRHLIKNLFAAMKEEIVYISTALFCAILLLGAQYYRSAVGLNRVDSSIQTIAKTALPNETLPRRNELSTLEAKLIELEGQLAGMGSLSSLSPLESLMELSKTLTTDIQIDIDTLSIAESKIVFRGSVADNPTVGRLSTALEKNNKVFCAVKVDPSGRVPGSSRVRYTAEIELCN